MSKPSITGPFNQNSLSLLDQAIQLWVQEWGVVFVDLPWVVPAEYTAPTMPADRRDIVTPRGSFVASGEQSFLQLWAEERLPAGPEGYIGWTPCLRDEPQLDQHHQHGFLKAEWFVPFHDRAEDGTVMARLMTMLIRQRMVFQRLAAFVMGVRPHDAPEPTSLITGIGQVDYELGGLEIGSYGDREFMGRRYLFGTALALPRFQQALDFELAKTSF